MGIYIFYGIFLSLCTAGIATGIVAKLNKSAQMSLLEGTIPRPMNYLLWILPIGVISLLAAVVVLVDSFEITKLLDLGQHISLLVSIFYMMTPALVMP